MSDTAFIIIATAVLAIYLTAFAIKQHIWEPRRRRQIAARADVEAQALHAVAKIGLESWQAHRKMIHEELRHREREQ